MFVQVSEEIFINTDKVAKIQLSEDDGNFSYSFYGDNGNFIASTEYGSTYNSLVKRALAKLQVY
jgi:hypothetical protein